MNTTKVICNRLCTCTTLQHVINIMFGWQYKPARLQFVILWVYLNKRKKKCLPCWFILLEAFTKTLVHETFLANTRQPYSILPLLQFLLNSEGLTLRSNFVVTLLLLTKSLKFFFHVFPWPSALECKGLNILQWNKIKHDLSNLQCRKRNLLAQSDVFFFHGMKSGTLKRNTRYWQEMRSTEIVTKTGTSKNVLGNLIFKNLKQLQLLRS